MIGMANKVEKARTAYHGYTLYEGIVVNMSIAHTPWGQNGVRILGYSV